MLHIRFLVVKKRAERLLETGDELQMSMYHGKPCPVKLALFPCQKKISVISPLRKFASSFIFLSYLSLFTRPSISSLTLYSALGMEV